MKKISDSIFESREKFFVITCMLNKNPVGVELLNEKELLREYQKMFDVTDYQVRGFQHFNLHERPRYMHRRRLGRKPLDFEEVGGFWMLSEAAKNVIEQTCSDAVEFLAGELVFDDGSESRKIWLCDVTLVLDVLDEEKSHVNISNYGEKMYSIAGSKPGDFVLLCDVVKNNELFRMKYAIRTVMCGEKLKKILKINNIKGAMFFEVGYKLDK